MKWFSRKSVLPTSHEDTQKTVSAANSHVVNFLDYYLEFSSPPRYAVLLNGPWGVGKTYLISNYMKLKYAKRYLYVSLYGLSSAEEIDEGLFQALFPVMGWKSTKIAGRIATTAMKYVGLDLNMKLNEFLTNIDGKILLFDDLERCAMPMNEVLGYINALVEHDGAKVVVLCNENEIRADERPQYQTRKEKLIGKTLEVQSALDDALSHFISEIGDPSAREFLAEHRTEIQSIYGQFAGENLRILQQSLWDFARFYVALTAKHRENTSACTLLLRMLLALSFEVKGNRLVAFDLRNRDNATLLLMINNRDEDPESKEESAFVNACQRYPDSDLENSILSDDDLIDILFKGMVDETKIHVSINRSPFFVSPADEPAWRAVWHGMERTDAEFERSVSILEDQFKSRDFLIVGEVIHVFGLRLWLSKIHAISFTPAEVVDQCVKYIEDLYITGNLQAAPEGAYAEYDWNFGGYGGLGIHEVNSPELKYIITQLFETMKKVSNDQYPNNVAHLLSEMENNVDLYFRRLCLTNSDENIYYKTPILAHIQPKFFLENVFRQNPVSQKTIFSAFKARYQYGDLNDRLADEKPWLAEIRDLLVAYRKTAAPISRHRIEKFLEWNILPFVPLEATAKENKFEAEKPSHWDDKSSG